MLEPCGHATTCGACTPMLKKCIKCRVPIQRMVGFHEMCTGGAIDRAIASDVVKLKQELQGLKEQVSV